MNALAALSMSEGGLAVQSSQDGDKIQAVFSGVAELDVRDALPQLLKRLHLEAQQLKIKEVMVDFHRLEFMNSSCFKGFVSWINDIQELAEDKQYRLRFRSNPEILWQRRSVHALKCFATDLITVEE